MPSDRAAAVLSADVLSRAISSLKLKTSRYKNVHKFLHEIAEVDTAVRQNATGNRPCVFHDSTVS